MPTTVTEAVMTEYDTTSRRGLLDVAIRVCGAVAALALAVPALAYLWPVTRSGPATAREDVGEASSWRPWEGKKVAVGNQPVLVVRTDKEFVAVSAVCTHLGCLVEFDTTKRNILCPCHGARFDLAGAVIAGPPPSPLPRYEVSEVENRVYVSA
jgi:cytochrome b6-f complex iron-sulfur subunit